MTVESMENAVLSHWERRPGEYALSMNCVPGVTVREVAMQAKLKNEEIRCLTVQAIRDAGFEIVKSSGWEKNAHCEVFLASGIWNQPTPIQLLVLQRKLSEPIRNPWKEGAGQNEHSTT